MDQHGTAHQVSGPCRAQIFLLRPTTTSPRMLCSSRVVGRAQKWSTNFFFFFFQAYILRVLFQAHVPNMLCLTPHVWRTFSSLLIHTLIIIIITTTTTTIIIIIIFIKGTIKISLSIYQNFTTIYLISQ